PRRRRAGFRHRPDRAGRRRRTETLLHEAAKGEVLEGLIQAGHGEVAMPCEVKGNAIICSRRTRQRCAYCSNWSERLCDFQMTGGKTCDTPMCVGHAHHAGPDIDYCREHAQPRKPQDVTCPDCGGPMKARTSSYGKFWGCADYPQCKGTRDADGRSREERGH